MGSELVQTERNEACACFILAHSHDACTEKYVLPALHGDEYGIRGKTYGHGSTIIDVGGHIGTAAILFKLFHPLARIISFEPSPVNRLFFQLNLALNGLSRGSGGIELLGFALSHIDGAFLNITYNAIDTTGTSTYIKPTGGTREYDQVSKVPTMRLNTVLDRYAVDVVDFMILDCEGCEYDVLSQTSKRTLDTIGNVAGEVHPGFHSILGERKVKRVKQEICRRGWKMKMLNCSDL